MTIKKLTAFIYGLSILGLSQNLGIISPLYAADQNDSAQQALQQLRLLQNRFTQDNNSPNKTDKNDTKSSTSSVNELPTVINQPPATVEAAPQQPAQPAEETVSDNDLIDNKAFEGLTRQMFPLNPEQIVELRKLNQKNELAEITTVGAPPKPTAASQIVNLAPGSTPPVIRLSQGFVSSMVFLDSTGAPWPISAYDLGDPSSFNIQWDKTSNTLMVQALKLYNYGNLAVRLKGLNTPVMLTLIPGQKVVDYRVDLRVQGYGPMAKNLPMEEGIPPSANDVLLQVLDGVPPPNSQRLTINGGDAAAWLVNEKMYIRTNLTILSPGWIGSMTSADGMHAYEMQKSPVLLVSWHGKVMQIKVEGL